MNRMNDHTQLSRTITNFIVRKTHKDRRGIYKIFNKGTMPTDQEIVDMFNKSINIDIQRDPHRVSEKENNIDSKKEISYKTELIIEQDILPKMPGITYLDHGCGSGKITREIADHLGATTVYGIDIYEHDLLRSRNIIPVAPLDDGTIGLKDSSVDVITCLLSMHHVLLQEKTAQELVRILRPGGLLLLYEHDFDHSTFLKKYLDSVHVFYQIYGTQNEHERSESSNQESEISEKSDQGPKKITLSSVDWIFTTNYASRAYWRNIFESAGTTVIREFPVIGIQRMYFELFQK